MTSASTSVAVAPQTRCDFFPATLGLTEQPTPLMQFTPIRFLPCSGHGCSLLATGSVRGAHWLTP